MPRHGTTTQRGYGPEHQAAARKLKAAMRDGDPCCRCGQPMYRWQLTLDRNDIRGIDADHHELARALGGQLPDALAHIGDATDQQVPPLASDSEAEREE